MRSKKRKIKELSMLEDLSARSILIFYYCDIVVGIDSKDGLLKRSPRLPAFLTP